MFILDTNVVSELRKARKADPNVRKWADALPAANLYISAITVLELELGILRIERRDRKQGAVLRAWMEAHVLPTFAGRVLGIDTPVARKCAALHVANPRSDRDALIAATAHVHGMTIATRNGKDFQSMGVNLVNPWD